MSSKVGVPALINNRDHKATDTKKKTDIFADQFARVFRKELSGNLPVLGVRQRANTSIDNLHFIEETVKNV